MVSCSQDVLPHSGSADRPSYCWRLAQCSHRLCTAPSPNWALQIWVTESIGRRWNCGEREPEVSWQFKFNPLEIVLIQLRNWSHGRFVWSADLLPKDSWGLGFFHFQFIRFRLYRLRTVVFSSTRWHSNQRPKYQHWPYPAWVGSEIPLSHDIYFQSLFWIRLLPLKRGRR